MCGSGQGEVGEAAVEQEPGTDGGLGRKGKGELVEGDGGVGVVGAGDDDLLVGDVGGSGDGALVAHGGDALVLCARSRG